MTKTPDFRTFLSDYGQMILCKLELTSRIFGFIRPSIANTASFITPLSPSNLFCRLSPSSKTIANHNAFLFALFCKSCFEPLQPMLDFRFAFQNNTVLPILSICPETVWACYVVAVFEEEN